MQLDSTVPPAIVGRLHPERDCQSDHESAGGVVSFAPQKGGFIRLLAYPNIGNRIGECMDTLSPVKCAVAPMYYKDRIIIEKGINKEWIKR